MWMHTYTDVCTGKSQVDVGCLPFEEPQYHKDLPLSVITCCHMKLGTNPENIQTWLMESGAGRRAERCGLGNLGG